MTLRAENRPRIPRARVGVALALVSMIASGVGGEIRSFTGGGGRSVASGAVVDAGLGGIIGVSSASPQGAVFKAGFIGQLTEVTHLVVRANPAVLSAGQTSQLSGLAELDDGTVVVLTGSEIQWDPPAPESPFASISTNGVLTAAAVVTAYQAGTVTGAYLGVSGSTVVEVVSAPVVATLAATGVEPDETGLRATLNGSVNPSGRASSAWFEWGTSTNYGQTTEPIAVGAGVESVPVSVDLSGLVTGAAYHFRLVAANDLGMAAGDDEVFGLQTIQVVSLADSGPGTLRQAVAEAGVGFTITFGVTGTVALTGGELVLNKSLAIVGPGAELLVVDGGSSNRLFHIASAAAVSLSDLTLANGRASVGGAIFSQGTLVLERCVLEDNEADSGRGGAVAAVGPVTVRDTRFQGNRAATDGGAIDSQNGWLDLARCSLVANQAGRSGGAVWSGVTVPSSPVTLSGGGRSSTYANANLNGTEGPLATVAPGAPVTFVVDYTTAYEEGGGGCPGCLTQHHLGINGIFADCHDLFVEAGTSGQVNQTFAAPVQPGVYYLNQSSTWWYYCGQFGVPGFYNGPESAVAVLVVGSPSIQVANCTFSGNQAATSGGALGVGPSVGFDLLNCTLTANGASVGGGLSVDAEAGVTRLRNTIIAGNAASELPDLAGLAQSAGHNVIGSSVELLDQQSSDLVAVDARLGALLANGSALPSHAPLPGSPALDTGDPSLPLETDQRGYPRPQRGTADTTGTDRGAIEVQPPSLEAPADQLTAEDTPLGPLSFLVSDPESAADSLVVTASSPNGVLFPPGSLTMGGIGETRTVFVAPAANAHGSAPVEILVTDGHGVSTLAAFTVTVASRNDPPRITAPASLQVVEDVPAAISEISFADVDAGTNAILATFSVTAGQLGALSGNGVSASGGPRLTRLEGSVPEINQFLSAGRLSFVTDLNATEPAGLTVSISDRGASGQDAVTNVARADLVIRVTPVNDLPVASTPVPRVILEDGTGLAAVTVSDVETEIPSLVLSAVNSSNPALLPLENVTVRGLSPERTVVFFSAPDRSGDATVTLRVTDLDGGFSEVPLSVTVLPVNDAPGFTLSSQRIEVLRDSQSWEIPGFATGITAGPPDEAGQTLGFRLTNDNPRLFTEVPVISPAGTLRFVVQSNVFGLAEGLATLEDSGGEGHGGVDQSAPQRFEIEVVSWPVITNQPAAPPWELAPGTSLALTVGVEGTQPLRYQWTRNWIAMPGATNATLPFDYLDPANAGDYRALVRNPWGAVTSQVARLLVGVPQSGPVVVREPLDQDVPVGGTLVLSAEAAGEPPLRYQWRRNDTPLANGDGSDTNRLPLLKRGSVTGAASNVLTIAQFQPADAGTFQLLVENALGVVTSRAVRVRVVGLTSLALSDGQPESAVVLTDLAGERASSTAGFTTQTNLEGVAANTGWVRWRAEQAGSVTFTVAGSGYDTLLEGFSDAGAMLVTDDDGGGFLTSYGSFNASRNAEYSIGIAGLDGVRGDVVLSWLWNEHPTPEIVEQPASVIARKGESRSFRVTVSSSSAVAYQWRRNGSDLEESNHHVGVHRPELTVPAIEPGDVGVYTVEVVNEFGRSVASAPAVLDIVDGVASRAIASGFKPEVMLREVRTLPALLTTGRSARLMSGFQSVSAGTIISDNFRPRGQGGRSQTVVLGGSSRWYYLPVTTNGLLTVETTGSGFDSVLEVYAFPRANVASRGTLQGSDDNSAPDGRNGLVRFLARTNDIYLAVVDGRNGADGLVNLQWEVNPGPAPDNFRWFTLAASAVPAPGYAVVGLTNGIGKVHLVYTGQDYRTLQSVRMISDAASLDAAPTKVWFPVAPGLPYLVLAEPVAGVPPGAMKFSWTFLDSPPPTVALNEGRVTVGWPVTGLKLQTAERVDGPWFNVPARIPVGATKDAITFPPGEGERFFRVVPAFGR